MSVEFVATPRDEKLAILTTENPRTCATRSSTTAMADYRAGRVGALTLADAGLLAAPTPLACWHVKRGMTQARSPKPLARLSRTRRS